MTHPATQFGAWLKAKRQDARIVMRVFAGHIGMAPSEYAEVEAGIVHWLRRDHLKLIVETLALDSADEATCHDLLHKAKAADPLAFEDVFSREQLEPIRTRNNNRKQLTRATQDEILDAVFTPLQ